MPSRLNSFIFQILETINRIFFGVKPSLAGRRKLTKRSPAQHIKKSNNILNRKIVAKGKSRERSLVSAAKVKKNVKSKKTQKANIKPAKKVSAINLKPKGKCVGEITHYFPKIHVVVLKMTEGYLRVGNTIMIYGNKGNFSQTVDSLQIESVDVKAAQKGQLVGMKVAKEPQIGDKVYKQ